MNQVGPNRMSKTDDETKRVVLEFDLYELPTAQHRAGLAGMLFLIDWMKAKKLDPGNVPEVEELTATTARVALTEVSTGELFDCLYSARITEARSAKKWPKSTPKREERLEVVDRKTGKIGQSKRYVYDVVQPQGEWIRDAVAADGESPWLKLWRDMVWSIPRGIPLTRAPFAARAAGRHCQEGKKAWEDVRKAAAKRASSQFLTAGISGSLLLSAQAISAENVPFIGRVEQNLLLHFWQVVVMTYVPQTINHDGKRQSAGYVLAVPDVSHLPDFLASFRWVLHGLDSTTRGYRPARALIDVPAQSALEFLRWLSNLAQSKAGREDWMYSVSAIESFHMTKLGNNIKLLAFDRVANRQNLIADYAGIERTFRNPLFRQARLRALLRGAAWYDGMLELFSQWPWYFFVESDDTPKFLPRFGADARRRFEGILEDTRNMKTEDMQDDERLARIVQRLVRTYVDRRAEAKTGKKVRDFPLKNDGGKATREYPHEFREAQKRACSDAFFAMRSRHDQDFVSYFAGSICSVPQALKAEDYEFLTRILMTRPAPSPVGSRPLSWEDVKAIAMIAVSACSFIVQPREKSTT
jgi:CRISPR-associated protein Cmx8